jgi:hypothetical protein
MIEIESLKEKRGLRSRGGKIVVRCVSGISGLRLAGTDGPRARCGFGPSILKVAQDAQAGRRRPQSLLRVSAQPEEGALTIDQYMAH